MRRALLLSVVLALAASGARDAEAVVCTVSDARVLVRNFDLEAALPSLVGYAIPVEIAETSGNFRLDCTDFPTINFSLVGVDSDFDLPPQGFDGTLDAAGNVVVPDVPLGFVTNATMPPTAVGAVAALTTGITALTVSGRDYVAEGAALDFQTGQLTLAGHGIVLDAPLAGMPVTTGFSVTCTLDQIPTRANLPPGPSLPKATGRGKLAKPTTDGTVVGDRLTLRTTFVPADVALDVAAEDLFFRIPGETDAGPPVVDHAVLIRVPAGTLTARGKKLVASDEDGSKIRLVKGRKRDGNAAAALAGSVIVKPTKRGLAITVKQVGADLGRLRTGASEVLVGVGELSASDATTVTDGRRAVVIK